MKLNRIVLIIMLISVVWTSGGVSLALHAPTLLEEIDSLIVDKAPIVGKAASVTPRCFIEIDRVEVTDGRLDDTLDIWIETIGFDLAGCMLKIGVSSGLVDIIDILPGEIIDSCRWDMFRATEAAPTDKAGSQLEVWQVTGLARGVGAGDESTCFGFDRPAILARIVVSSAHLPMVADTSVGLFFYWESCRDNVISDRAGASIIISDTVFQQFAPGLATGADRFPTIHGTPTECVSDRAANKPRRLINFQAGGVEFRLRSESP